MWKQPYLKHYLLHIEIHNNLIQGKTSDLLNFQISPQNTI